MWQEVPSGSALSGGSTSWTSSSPSSYRSSFPELPKCRSNNFISTPNPLGSINHGIRPYGPGDLKWSPRRPHLVYVAAPGVCTCWPSVYVSCGCTVCTVCPLCVIAVLCTFPLPLKIIRRLLSDGEQQVSVALVTCYLWQSIGKNQVCPSLTHTI